VTIRRVIAPILLLAALVPVVAAPAREALRSKFELFVHDVDASVRFYGVLGFEVAHRKPSDDYTTLRSGEVVVALSPLPRWLPLHWLGFLRLPPLGTEIVFYADALPTMREALLAAGHRPGEIRLQPWGQRDFRLRDPDGYYVRISEG
jgi:catechol 2,3-dioxygenase-like lactoylglutathione lyase family enzyme